MMNFIKYKFALFFQYHIDCYTDYEHLFIFISTTSSCHSHKAAFFTFKSFFDITERNQHLVIIFTFFIDGIEKLLLCAETSLVIKLATHNTSF